MYNIYIQIMGEDRGWRPYIGVTLRLQQQTGAVAHLDGVITFRFLWCNGGGWRRIRRGAIVRCAAICLHLNNYCILVLQR